MVLIPVLCPHCQSDQVIKGGKTPAGKQRYKCQNMACPVWLKEPADSTPLKSLMLGVYWTARSRHWLSPEERR